ncbi:MAG: hypothetical protein QME35_03775 [Thermoanaerobacteraceae bacterium]|nr:hypothetical protein [Thermoanaerobacteraceae bacterium]
MPKYLTYVIEALENLKLAKTNVQLDSQESMEYITGSAVRGAFIYEYMKKKSIFNINEGIHREKLLKGGIKFLNAYPINDKYDKRSIPFPNCYFAPKEKIRIFKSEKKIEIICGLDNKLDRGYEKVRVGEFCEYVNNEYKILKVDKISNLHINKSKERNNLFRYESIKRGQIFKGIIKVEDESYVDEIKELLRDVEIYIGGSKGSGYGRCRITNIKLEEDNPEYQIFKDKYYFKDYIFLYAMSDIIYRNELGEYKTFIEPEYICKELNLKKVEFIDSSIETKRITNFNNKWNCRTPQIIGIKAGSVFKYRIEGDIDKKVLKKFTDKGIGERKADGFGRFVIIDSMNDSYLNYDNERESNKKDLADLLEKLTEKDKNQLRNIITQIFKKRAERMIPKEVLSIDEGIKGKINNSQWGIYKDLFSDMLFKDPDKGVKRYNEYMDYIINKRSSSYKQLNKVEYKSGNLKNLFDKYILYKEEDVGKILDGKLIDNKIEFGEIQSIIDKKFLYETNLKILIGLCQFQIRKGEK